MMRRSLLKSAYLWRPTPVWRPAPTRLLSSTKGTEVFDKELHQEELTQVTNQMEDAIMKEKEVHDSTQHASKNHKTWDPCRDSQAAPDHRTKQSKTVEMDAILKEQQKLVDQNSLHGMHNTPLGKERNVTNDSEYKTKVNDSEYLDHESRSADGTPFHRTSSTSHGKVDSSVPMVDQMTQSARETAKSMMGAGHDLKEATTSSMHDLKEMAKGMVAPMTTFDSKSTMMKSMKDMAHDAKESVEGSMHNIKEGVKDVLHPEGSQHETQMLDKSKDDGMKMSSGQNPSAMTQIMIKESVKDMLHLEPNNRPSDMVDKEPKVTDIGDNKPGKKPRSKKFSENRQNSSPL